LQKERPPFCPGLVTYFASLRPHLLLTSLSVAAPLSFPRSSQAIHQEQAEKFSQEEKLGIGHFSDRTLYNGNKDPVIGHFAFVAYVVAFVFRWLLDQVESWFIMCKFSK